MPLSAGDAVGNAPAVALLVWPTFTCGRNLRLWVAPALGGLAELFTSERRDNPRPTHRSARTSDYAGMWNSDTQQHNDPPLFLGVTRESGTGPRP